MPTDIIKKNNVTVINESSEKTIIFAHGFGTDQSAWADIVPVFVPHYRIILYDNVGAGNADPNAFSPNKYDSLNTYANDLIDICKKLNVQDAIMVAHSVSGMISLLATIKSPDLFSKIILIGASPRYLNDDNYVGGFDQHSLDGLYQAMANNYFAWVSGFSAAAMANADRPQLSESFAKTLSAIRPDVAQSVARVIFQSDNRSILPQISTPTLILQTKHDMAVPQEVATYLHNNIANSELIIIDAEGHFPHISAAKVVTESIQNYIGQ